MKPVQKPARNLNAERRLVRRRAKRNEFQTIKGLTKGILKVEKKLSQIERKIAKARRRGQDWLLEKADELSGWKRAMLLTAGVALWYNMNGAPFGYPSAMQRYPLPKEIPVIETTLPSIRIKPLTERIMNIPKEKPAESTVKTDGLNLSGNFEMKTQRYTLIKKEDRFLTRLIGHVMSIPSQMYFYDSNVGWGLDEEKTRAVLSMLENDKSLVGLTVRINHNEAFHDWYRMMTQEDLKERYPFLYRLTIGSIVTLKDEMWAEFFRGDYYNPMTKTAVLYSNIESISAHEFGHHIDFLRFERPWIYDIARAVPLVMLYQEWKASSNAMSILSRDDEWQRNRYLLPAFLTYVLATLTAIYRKKDNE